MPWCEGLTDAPPPAPGAGGESVNLTLDRQQDKAAASLEPVSAVDLNRYAGLWHEIARIPNRFQRQCVRDSLAVYTLRADGSIAVLNLCVKRNGAVDQARGVARVVDRISQARLKVSLLSVLGWRPFWGDYWLIGLDPDYRWAIVGEARRRFGWILLVTVARERCRAGRSTKLTSVSPRCRCQTTTGSRRTCSWSCAAASPSHGWCSGLSDSQVGFLHERAELGVDPGRWAGLLYRSPVPIDARQAQHLGGSSAVSAHTS